jgi:arginine-tRNA-protein transferase
MLSLFSYIAPPSRCGYLPQQQWSLEYECVEEMTPAEYEARMQAGWRRFGRMLFHPRCSACRACRSLRVLAGRFTPDRSQRRAWKANTDVEVRIGPPSVSRAKLDLYDRFHAYRAQTRGWPLHPAKDADSYEDSFVNNPFPILEWCYYLDRRLIAVGYSDLLPQSLSAIYCFYEPDLSHRSLGTYNVLRLLDYAREHGLPYVYLGYYVEGCQSMAYKPRFRPNQILDETGQWKDFLSR